MPKSRARTKKPQAISGIPGRILDKSPAQWPAAKRALWCRLYIDGAAGRPLREIRDRRGYAESWQRQAFALGRREADESTADVAQDNRERDARRKNAETRERMRNAHTRGMVADLSMRMNGDLAPYGMENASLIADALSMGIAGALAPAAALGLWKGR